MKSVESHPESEVMVTYINSHSTHYYITGLISLCLFFQSVDISVYSQKHVDRFGVLLDLWACELTYLEKKKKVKLKKLNKCFMYTYVMFIIQLVDCYLEAYHQVSNKIEKDLVAQV